jgi:putative ABC transport system permease protein
VLTLALGMGISVTAFSVLHGVVLRTLPYPDADRIMLVRTENLAQGVHRSVFTTTEAEGALKGAPGFEHIAYYVAPPYVVTGDEGPRLLQVANVSRDYFAVFGVAAALGRTLRPVDFAEHRPVVVLNHNAWIALAGGDADVIGRTLTYRGVGSGRAGTLEVVGVLPESFAHPYAGSLLYVPWGTTRIAPELRTVPAVGRLAGESRELARQGLEARLSAVQEAHGLTESGWRISLVPLIDDLVGDVRALLIVVFMVSVLVLLVACSTTASLVSIRLKRRDAEFSIRRALGAGDARVAVDISLELALLATLGAIGGTLLAAAAVEALPRLAAGTLPRASGIAMDRAAIAFAAASALASLLLGGLAPLLRTLHADSGESLRAGPRSVVAGGRRIALLPSAGIGLATVALVAAMALSMSLIRLGNIDLGFRTEAISALQLVRAQPQEQVIQFLDRVIPELRALPGVADVAAVAAFPPTMQGSGVTPLDVSVPGQDSSPTVTANVRAVSASYHRLLDIPLLRGRDISEQDSLTAPRVAVINETLARGLFDTTDAAGQTLMVSFGGRPVSVEIVGVVADTRNAGLRAAIRPELTFPISQYAGQFVTLLVDTPVRSPDWTGNLEKTVWRVDPGQAINRIYPLAADLDAQTRSARFMATATGWFALLALLLGSVGVNSVVAAMQQRREREIGLRLALGAPPHHAAALVLVSATRIVAAGLTAGALLALPALGWLEGQLFGVERGELWKLFAVTAIVLTAAALTASAWPAWHASRISPTDALRNE